MFEIGSAYAPTVGYETLNQMVSYETARSGHQRQFSIEHGTLPNDCCYVITLQQNYSDVTGRKRAQTG
jgi:hypothetical protein